MTKEFIFEEMKFREPPSPEKAEDGDIYDCLELNRRFFCGGDYWLVKSSIYIGNLIKISRDMGNKLLKNKTYCMYYSFKN